MTEANMHGMPVTELATRVQRLARRLARRLSSHTDVGDLVSAGHLGLMDAARGFEPGRVNFWTYAEHRVRGAMLDWLRQQDVLAKDARSAVRGYAAVVQRLTHELGRTPEPSEVALELGVSVARCEALYADANAAPPISMEMLLALKRGDGIPDPSATDPCEAASDAETRERVIQAIDTLPERLRFVVVEHYHKERTLREIGDDLGVTVSRACQLLGEAHQKLEPALKHLCDWEPPAAVH